ncbi:extracellular solute-binding protein [Rathayibacter sp. Leaf296]|uniref:extracellular solute-binding protein n=1 Tax=Rathayibacter sp. Leaf296 TaxID=1736327 RepID=UPI0007032147|nr:extracellular solute-binding protein [Rathayibacter sp. Leaf296]KQQ08668.1 ABC transporter substrate-binding protein [Rathayibacter sp. Leaf296]
MMIRTPRRSTLAGLAVLATGALLLTGCGRGDGTATAAGEAVGLSDGPATGELTIWAQGTEGEALPELLQEFEEQNPDLDVTVTAVPWDSAQSKYQTAIAGGNTPDIGMLGSDWMPTFSDALSPVPDEIDTSGMFPGAVASTEIGEEVLGVPWYVETRAIFYRTDLMEEAGFDSFPTDFEGFKALAKAYQDNGAQYGVALPSGGWNAFLSGMPFAWSQGAELQNDGGTEWTLDSPEMIEAVTYLKSFFDEGIASKNPDATTGPSADLVAGTVPMMMSGPWDVGQIMEAGGPGFEDKFSVAPMPVGTSGTSLIAGANLAVFEESENKEAAWKLIQWLSEPSTQTEWFELVGDLPSQTSAWEDQALTEDPRVAVFGEQLKDVRGLPALTVWPEISAAADTLIEQVYRGGADPAEALASLQETADAMGTGQ